MDVIADFQAFMESHGIVCPEPIVRDGERHRFAMLGERKKDAWYRLYPNDPPAGNFGHWRMHPDGKGVNWSRKPDRVLSKEEIEAHRREDERRKKQRQREIKVLQEITANKAREVWSVSAPDPAKNHGYVIAKGIEPHVGRVFQGETHTFENESKPLPINQGDLVVPITREGKLVSVQLIRADGSGKFFLPKTPTTGSYCLIGPKPTNEIVICEGYATGASIHEATGLPVFVAFNCGNLKPVAKALRQRNPDARILIVADDDRFKEQNAGIKCASEAAGDIDVRGTMVRPRFKPKDDESKPTDFNDLARLYGLDEVKTQILTGKPSFDIEALVEVKRAEVLSEELRPQIVFLANEPPPSSALLDRYSACGLAMNMNGNPLSNTDNVVRVLQSHQAFRGMFWVDEFHLKCFTTIGGKQAELSERDEIRLMIIMQREFGMRTLGRSHTREAIEHVAGCDTRNEPKDWLHSLKWDGNPRIESFFSVFMGADENPYTATASKNWWVGMVARIFEPGCKLDTMVIFEGAQGKRKSSALEAVGGKWFTEASDNPREKDFYLCIQGHLIVEIAELNSFTRADVNAIKKLLSVKKDRFRPPFGRRPEDFPRQSIFVGTTNDVEYLQDTTGNRRFWPVNCVKDIQIEKIKDEREQLFAEAVHAFKANAKWWEMPDDAADEQDARRQPDIWETPIADWLGKKTSVDVITVHGVATECLGFCNSQLTHAHSVRIGKILRLFGLSPHPARVDGRVVKRFTKN
jgi:putative DNA primase/helicase